MKSIRIVLAGPRGRMGSLVLDLIRQTPEMCLVACIDRHVHNQTKVPVFTDAKHCFNMTEADVLIDFTVAAACFEHSQIAISHKVRPVIGTSGMTEEQINDLLVLTEKHQTGCIIAPNFSIGAILMMQFAKMAIRLFPDAEIIEKHHDLKLDAPSGTAATTAEEMVHARDQQCTKSMQEKSATQGDCPDKTKDDIPIHSVRLPGLLAHHEIIFGGKGETFTIKHDSHSRESFMGGLKWAIMHVMTLDHLVYGLNDMIDG